MPDLQYPDGLAAQLDSPEEASEAYRLLGQIFASFTHDLAQPMGYILTNLDFVLGDIGDTDHRLAPHVLGSLHDAHHGATVLLQLLRDVQCFMKGDSAGLEDVALNEPVETAVRLCKRQLALNAVQVEMSVPSNLYVYSNEAVLLRALCNVLANAGQAFERAEGIKHRRVRINCELSASTVNLHISDNGPGIPEENLQKIFEPGFSSKPAGSGIGLCSARSSLERVGAKLEVERRAPGEGAGFVLTIPRN